ncbi:MAG: bifunctional riboflavin kinase/FAD synthetase [Kineosporiaceae bacterium]
MQRWFGLDRVPGDVGPTVVTLGNFDGVHRGHVAVLRRVVAEARRRGAASLAVTFDPHPIQVLYPDRAPTLLTAIDERLDLLAATGLDAVLVQPFTPELARMPPDEYVERVFVRALGARAVVIGGDVRFGYRNSGDISTLRTLGKTWGFEVVTLEDLGADAPERGDGTRRWSSTWVRELLAAGDVAGAAQVLGRPHAVTGTVVHGDARGRLLGYPTANLGSATVGGMVPADGVYGGRLRSGDAPALPAAVSIGTNPQFDGHERRVEAYVIDAVGLDLYDRSVRVEFLLRVRDTLRFDSVDALVARMGRDVAEVRAALGSADVTAGTAEGPGGDAGRPPGPGPDRPDSAGTPPPTVRP